MHSYARASNRALSRSCATVGISLIGTVGLPDPCSFADSALSPSHAALCADMSLPDSPAPSRDSRKCSFALSILSTSLSRRVSSGGRACRALSASRTGLRALVALRESFTRAVASQEGLEEAASWFAARCAGVAGEDSLRALVGGAARSMFLWRGASHLLSLLRGGGAWLVSMQRGGAGAWLGRAGGKPQGPAVGRGRPSTRKRTVARSRGGAGGGTFKFDAPEPARDEGGPVGGSGG
jgi:hypothetical protein